MPHSRGVSGRAKSVTILQSKGSDVFNGCDLGTAELGTILDSGFSDGSSPVIIGTGSDDTGTHPGAW